eukprot:scaffold10671_cov62-Isochrysis_galbana.AAC.1
MSRYTSRYTCRSISRYTSRYGSFYRSRSGSRDASRHGSCDMNRWQGANGCGSRWPRRPRPAPTHDRTLPGCPPQHQPRPPQRYSRSGGMPSALLPGWRRCPRASAGLSASCCAGKPSSSRGT